MSGEAPPRPLSAEMMAIQVVAEAVSASLPERRRGAFLRNLAELTERELGPERVPKLGEPNGPATTENRAVARGWLQKGLVHLMSRG